MFTQLSKFLDEGKLKLLLSKKGGLVAVTVIPTAMDGTNLFNTPLSISGTAEELDEHFITEMEVALMQGLSFKSNKDEFVKAAKEESDDDALSEEKDKADKGKTQPVKPAATTKGPAQTKQQKDAIALGKKNITAAEKATDPDIIEFHRNGTIKAYKEAKMDELSIEQINQQFDAIKPKEKAATQQPDLFDDKKVEEEPPAPEEEAAQEEQEPDGETAEAKDEEIIKSEEDDDDIF